jgi:hypothetical protein
MTNNSSGGAKANKASLWTLLFGGSDSSTNSGSDTIKAGAGGGKAHRQRAQPLVKATA